MDDFNWLISKNLQPKLNPHGSNLVTKINKIKNKDDLSKSVSEYRTFWNATRNYYLGRSDLKDFVENTNNYYDFYTNLGAISFSHQSDFLSSIIPEALSSLFKKVIKDTKISNQLEVSAQHDSLVEMNFDPKNGGSIIQKKKRLDLAVFTKTDMLFRDQKLQISIPSVCVEVKTNLDKNMISGIETTSETLKRTFPKAKYFVITEFSDFDTKSQNYAATNIDEIFILRKQTRGSKRKTKTHRPLSVELIEEIRTNIESTIYKNFAKETLLSDRIKSGKLNG